MESTKERLLAWWRESIQNIRNGAWWLVAAPIFSFFLYGTLEHRLFGWLNNYIDSNAGKCAAKLLTVGGSFLVPLVVLAALLLFFIIRAYFKSQPGIVGTADLMVQELDVTDLEIADEGYVLNLAAFARMEVASLDKPRTVTRFEMEMTAPDKTKYRARSEYELGKFQHKYELKKMNEWGASTIQSKREPMEDLAAKLRSPIQPFTHVGRAWVRFELPKVKAGHEPSNCYIRIFAIDPSGKRHEIKADGMQVKAITDHEFAVAVHNNHL